MTDRVVFIVAFSFLGVFVLGWIVDRIIEQRRGRGWMICDHSEHFEGIENRLSAIAEIVEKIETNLDAHPSDMVKLLGSIDDTLNESRDANVVLATAIDARLIELLNSITVASGRA